MSDEAYRAIPGRYGVDVTRVGDAATTNHGIDGSRFHERVHGAGNRWPGGVRATRVTGEHDLDGRRLLKVEMYDEGAGPLAVFGTLIGL